MRRKATRHRCDRAKRRDYEEHGVEPEGADDVAVKQVMQRARRAAAGALQSRQFVEDAAREEVHGGRVEAIEDRGSSDRKQPGQDANERC